MLDPKTKERIAQEAHLPTHDDCEAKKKTAQLSALERFIYDQEPVEDGEWREQLRAAIIEAREVEATRAQELIEAYRELCKIQNDTLNEMEKLIKDYEPNREKVARAYELLKKIEALTKYNNP